MREEQIDRKRHSNIFVSSIENLLPEEIILDILSRLPVESVFECRRVCKTWRTLTFHPSFAHLHLHHSHTAAKVGFISQGRLDIEREYHLYYGEYDENDEHKPCKKLRKIKQPSVQFAHSLVVGSCDGLICLSVFQAGCRDAHDPVFIYNPITREYFFLPRFENKCCKGSMVLGFGYHPSTHEYKVVRMYNSLDQPSVGQVQVYTLGEGSGWRNKGEFKYPSRLTSLSARCTLGNGALHWVDYGDGKIVSFDLADEEFRFLPSPPFSGDKYLLREFGGLLCAIHHKKGECVKIWSLKKNKKNMSSGSSYDMTKEQECESWSWSLEFSIQGKAISSPNFRVQYNPFALSKNGEVLFWNHRGFLSCYNLKTTSVLDTIVNDYASVVKHFNAIPHINSFISLKAVGEDAKIMGLAK